MTSELRVGDAERDASAARLREHAARGRLTLEELDERLDRALAARTRADLAALEGDLPRAPRPDPSLRPHVTAYVAVMAGMVVLWALTGFGYFWPIWPMLGWGIGVVSHARGGAHCKARSTSAGLTAPSRTIDHAPSS
jgi:hypothetical protein